MLDRESSAPSIDGLSQRSSLVSTDELESDLESCPRGPLNQTDVQDLLIRQSADAASVTKASGASSKQTSRFTNEKVCNS